MIGQKLVARYVSGKVLKGHTTNFSPAVDHFVMILGGEGESAERVPVDLVQLKALFFVRDFAGNPNRRDREYFKQHQVYQGRRIQVTFCDGEVLAGSTPNYDAGQLGFFIFPADTESNTIKVFAVNTNVRKVKFL